MKKIRNAKSSNKSSRSSGGAPAIRSAQLNPKAEARHPESSLRDFGQKQRGILDNLQEGVFQTTPEGTFLAVNRALVQMLGFASEQELIETRRDIAHQHYVNAADRERFKRELESSGSVSGFEYEAYRKDGSRIWLSENGRAVYNGEGVLAYYEGTMANITERKEAEKALRESEERYRELFENSRDAIYVHDIGGRYLSVNRAAEQLSGYGRSEIIGKHYSNFIAPSYLRNARENFCRKLDVPIETTYEAEVRCKNGRLKPVEVSSRMIFRNGEAIGVQGTVRDITERKRAQKVLQTYSRRLIQAQEAERESIARELHDEIGQALTAISMNLQWIHRYGAASTSAQPRIQESIEVINDTLRHVRELSLELRPSLLDDLGLAAALRWYTAKFSARTGIATEMIGDLPESHDIDRAVQTACYRIAQEALTNTARHSAATKAAVTLERTTNDQLRLTVIDDGVGFSTVDLNGPNAMVALGLRGMQERALAVQGRFDLHSEPGKGTRVSLVVPILSVRANQSA